MGKIADIISFTRFPYIKNLCHSSITHLKGGVLYAFVCASFLSIFIYLNQAKINIEILDFALAFLAVFMLFKSTRNTAFLIGFFASIFWFWWIALAFVSKGYLVAGILAIGFVGLVFGGVFYIIFLFNNYFYRLFSMLFGFELITPFGFLWFNPKFMLANTHFSPSYFAQFSFLVFVLLFVLKLPKKILIFSPLLIFLGLDLGLNEPKLDKKAQELSPKISIINTQILQEQKWKKEFKNAHLKQIFELIDKEIAKNQKLVILPESVFAMYLNKNTKIMNKLLEKSKKISIVTGALRLEKAQAFNSIYVFQNGSFKVYDKVFLTPFGEITPFKNLLNFLGLDRFLYFGDDFTNGTNVTNMHINGVDFRLLICYEASVQKAFLNAPKQAIVISNNAWFYPSIEPSLQEIIMKYYAKKYSLKIYHSANMAGGGVIN